MAFANLLLLNKTVIVANLLNTKCKVIDAYLAFLKKLKKGYPLRDYAYIKESMIAINHAETDDLTSEQINRVLEHININIIKHS